MANINKIFGVPIDTDFQNSLQMALGALEEFKISGIRKIFTIASLNPEILNLAKRDASFKRALCGFDARIVDGFGVQLVVFLKGRGTVARIAGSDLSEQLLEYAIQKNMKIAIISRKDGLSEKNEIEKFFCAKGARFEILHKRLEEKEDLFVEKNLKRLETVKIIFVFLGAPYQEKLLAVLRRKVDGPKIGICAGGTIDFWTGKRKRAPKPLRLVGLEWIWRFLRQPNRLLRAWDSVVIFPLQALWEKTPKINQKMNK